MTELSYDDLKAEGVEVDTIAVCEKLRRLATLDRIKIDETVHRSGLNKHLFDYIEYCGLDLLTFIKEYLSNLQPYMIERRKDQEYSRHTICVIDNLYRVSVYIKVDNTQFEELIVSFHEDNIRGVAKTNSLMKNDTQKYVPIFADRVLSQVSSENKYIVKGLFQRGLKVLPVELPAIKCEDVFVVEKKAIDLQFLSYCNDYIKDLYTSNLDIDFSKIEVFSILQQISFTSYGKNTFSSVSLLIDSLCVQHDFVSKTTADFALVTFVKNLQLTDEQKTELINLLEEKFKVTSIKNIDLIISRIRDNLLPTSNEDEVIEECKTNGLIFTSCTGGIVKVDDLEKYTSILYSVTEGVWQHGVVTDIHWNYVCMSNGEDLLLGDLCMPLVKCAAPELAEKETIRNSMRKYGQEHNLSYGEVVKRVVKSIPSLYNKYDADDVAKAEYYWPVFIQTQ